MGPAALGMTRDAWLDWATTARSVPYNHMSVYCLEHKHIRALALALLSDYHLNHHP